MSARGRRVNATLARAAVALDVLFVLLPIIVFGWRWVVVALILIAIPGAVSCANVRLAARTGDARGVTLLTVLCLAMPFFFVVTILGAGPGG